MSDSHEEKKAEQASPSRWQRGSAALAKRIFNAELPEQFIRTIPAQSLFCVLKHNGLASSGDLLEIATIEQCRLMMDLDLWSGDSFQEDTFWEWLAVTDATEGLELLQKLFKCFDLKLVSLLIARYVVAVVHDEPTEEQPGDGFYSPDKGQTWLKVDTKSEDNDFLLNRLLALIFETDADLFYQLMSIPGVATPTQLEEDSFQDKIKRLASEGIPEEEIASELRTPLAVADALTMVDENPATTRAIDVFIVEPLIYDSANAGAIERLFASARDKEALEGELTFILNCAFVSWKVPFHEPEATRLLVEQVKGAIAIGIEALEKNSNHEVGTLFGTLGLKNLFRVGHTQLMALQRQALKIRNDALKAIADSDKELFAIVAGLREPFPNFCRSIADESAESESLPRVTAFASLEDVEKTLERLTAKTADTTVAAE